MLIFILCLLALYIVYFVNVQFIEILGNRILVKRERLHNMGFETIMSRNFHWMNYLPGEFSKLLWRNSPGRIKHLTSVIWKVKRKTPYILKLTLSNIKVSCSLILLEKYTRNIYYKPKTLLDDRNCFNCIEKHWCSVCPCGILHLCIIIY